MNSLSKSNRFKSMLIGLLITISPFLMMGAQASAFDWHTANQITVAWEAVTTKTDGTPLAADDTVEYVVYLANAISDPDKANPTQVWRGAATEAVITLGVEGEFLAGVKAIRKIADGTEVGESVIAWSDEPLYTNDKTFGLRYFLPPAAIQGLKPK